MAEDGEVGGVDGLGIVGGEEGVLLVPRTGAALVNLSVLVGEAGTLSLREVCIGVTLSVAEDVDLMFIGVRHLTA